MKMLIGLGNPGSQYTNTRHNAGFMVVDRLIDTHAKGQPVKGRFQAATVEGTVGGERVIFMKPTTFMNLSGRSVGEAVRFFKVEDLDQDLLVIIDDLYLPTGTVRMKPSGGAGGHNGLTDIQRALGHENYPRLRVGVGQQPDGGKPLFMDQADFVLSRFTKEEEPLLDAGVTKAATAAEAFVTRGLAATMNQVNAGEQRPKKPRPEGM